MADNSELIKALLAGVKPPDNAMQPDGQNAMPPAPLGYANSLGQYLRSWGSASMAQQPSNWFGRNVLANPDLAGALMASNFVTPGARMPRVMPKRLEQGLAGEPGYAYHATNAERLQDIASEGRLNTHRAHEFTDQGAWPDGSTEARSYFGASPEHLYQFAPEEGMPVVVRTKQGGHILKESTGDLYARKPIEAQHLEFLGDDGAWHPVSSLKGE